MKYLVRSAEGVPLRVVTIPDDESIEDQLEPDETAELEAVSANNPS